MEVKDFLTWEEEQQVIDAIQEAEGNTSGEIRVHLEKSLYKDPIDRAKDVFCFLGMEKTRLKNGVLFYVAVDDHRFAIIGDKGINDLVPEDFWESIKNEVMEEFSKGNPAQGLVKGILHAGEKLKEFFPLDGDGKNELSDQISKHH